MNGLARSQGNCETFVQSINSFSDCLSSPEHRDAKCRSQHRLTDPTAVSPHLTFTVYSANTEYRIGRLVGEDRSGGAS